MKKTATHKKFSLDNQAVTVWYCKVRKAKGIRIKISSGDCVMVTGGVRTSTKSLEQFFLLHQPWVEKKLRYFRKFPNKTIKLAPEAYQEKKELTRKVVVAKLTQWNKYYGFSWKRVTVRNQSTRWGSCSSAGTLSFHAALIDLPEALQDYLIVHELCHLKAMNHSRQFWELLQVTLPQAKELDRQLKKYTNGSVL